jgi:hypothetical protein
MHAFEGRNTIKGLDEIRVNPGQVARCRRKAEFAVTIECWVLERRDLALVEQRFKVF